jgi:hypothetical protein
MSPLIPLLMFAIGATMLYPAFFAFDKLVRRQHDLYREEWEADGRPNGMFGRLEGGGYWAALRSGFATNRCMLVWLFRTPRWIYGDDQAARLLRRLRRLVLAWNLLVALLAIFMFVGPWW